MLDRLAAETERSRAWVLGAYQRHCAMTGSRIEPALGAAHIRPIKDGGIHRVDTRHAAAVDVHKLFDDGHLGVDDRFRLRVSPRFKSEFANGVEFYERERVEHAISMPAYRKLLLEREALTWHMDTVFESARSKDVQLQEGAPFRPARTPHTLALLGRANTGRARNGALFVHSSDVKNVAWGTRGIADSSRWRLERPEPQVKPVMLNQQDRGL